MTAEEATILNIDYIKNKSGKIKKQMQATIEKPMTHHDYTLAGNVLLLIAFLKIVIGKMFGFVSETLDMLAPYIGFFITYLLNHRKINEGGRWFVTRVRTIFRRTRLFFKKKR